MHFAWQGQYMAVQKTCSSDMLGGPGAYFLRRVAFWSIRSSGLLRTILHDRCSTSYDLASLFRGRRSTLDRWSGKIAKRIGRGRQLCTQLSMFEGSLAELFHCSCCQLRKLRKSRRIASFSSLQVDRQADKQIDRWIDRFQ